MGGGVYLAQGFGGDQGVDLGGGYRGMAQQFLDHAHVGAAFQQVRGEGVPQRVRGNVPVDLRPLRGVLAGWSRRFAG